MKIVVPEHSKDRFLFFCKRSIEKLISLDEDLKKSSEIIELQILYDSSNKPILDVKTNAEISTIVSKVESELFELLSHKEDSIEISNELKNRLLKNQDVRKILNDYLGAKNSATDNFRETGIGTIYDIVPYKNSMSCILTSLLKVPISRDYAFKILENLLKDFSSSNSGR